MTQNSPLVLLPGELKNQIIDYVFVRDPGTVPAPLRNSPLALSSTCRQLYEEYHALAWSATIFNTQWSPADELSRKTSILSPASTSAIRKLQIRLPSDLTEPYTADVNRKRVKSFGFARAGLTGLEELYIRYRPEHHEKGIGGPGRELIVQLLWRIMWERDIKQLNKICIVHDGTQPFLSLSLLYNMLQNFTPLQVSKRWKVRSDLEHGRLRFEERSTGEISRQISVVVGFSFREAEEYVEICEQILEVRLHYHVLLCSRYGVAQQCRIMDYVCSRVAKVDLSTGEACSNHCG
jgi:predicted secreted Zn-dependent protease